MDEIERLFSEDLTKLTKEQLIQLIGLLIELLGIISIIGYPRGGPLALLGDDEIIGIDFGIIAIIESGNGGHINRY